MLKIVPNELREAAYALGVPKWRTILKVVIPTSAAGIASGVTLAIARVIGETAPLLIAVGITTGVNLNPFDGRMATLPVFSYYSYVAPGVPREPFIDRAWTAALVLIILVMVLNIAARLIARSDDIEALAAGVRKDLKILSGWRFEQFGKDALDLVEGRLGFAIENGKLKMSRILLEEPVDA